MAREQEQFLDVVDRDTAERRWRAVIRTEVLQAVELLPLASLLGRVLARDVRAGVDVPAFDRSNVDGYAVRAEETYGELAGIDELPEETRLGAQLSAVRVKLAAGKTADAQKKLQGISAKLPKGSKFAARARVTEAEILECLQPAKAR